MYDDIKGASSDAGAALSIADKAGLNTLTNFADENFQVLRSLNRNMADTILKPSDEPYRVIAGYDNYNLETDNKSYLSGYDLSANSMYTFGDKRIDNKNRLGLGIGYTKISTSYDDGGDRDLNIVTVFMPWLHKFTDNLRLASVLSLGYGYGEYDRGSDRESDITDFFYGLTNELRYTVDLNGYAELEPALMLNALGYTEDGFDEGNGENDLVTKRRTTSPSKPVSASSSKKKSKPKSTASSPLRSAASITTNSLRPSTTSRPDTAQAPDGTTSATTQTSISATAPSSKLPLITSIRISLFTPSTTGSYRRTTLSSSTSVSSTSSDNTPAHTTNAHTQSV